MKISVTDLPTGDAPKPIDMPHFPTRQQAFVWRNWQLVPVERLAAILGTGRKNVLALAKGMGLYMPPRVEKDWLTRGYCTIIRNNWHLLPYGQLLQLLGWTAEQLDYTLREDDFLWVKLGKHKPAAQPVRFAPLTPEEAMQTRELRAAVCKDFGRDRASACEPPFAFAKEFRKGSPTPSVDKKTSRSPFELRLAYSYSAAYGDPLLQPEVDPYPDGILARYAAMGVNAVWLQGILYTLYPWDAFPGLSAGWQRRLENLRKLVKRAARFGIGVYLYFNEPRGLPVAAFKDRPDLKGFDFSGISTLCTSLPEIRRFLRGGSEHVFRKVPGLAGIFTITMNENPTNCCSRWKSAHECPRCSKRRPGEVIAEVNRLLADGAHAANSAARVLVWTWGWNPEWEMEAVDLLPSGVELMCVSEWGLPTRIGGVKGSVVDYSISQVGPSERSLRLWKRAQARGLKTIAKVQINNSWELSAVPYLPVLDLVDRHLGNLRKAGVCGLMVSWTVGGYPGGNLELLDRPPAELAVEKFGPRAAPLVRRAWRTFSRAFQELPLDCGVLYNSPINTGPANLLYPAPTGRKATMVQGFPYDDLKTWRNIYPEDVFERQFRKLSEGWRRGLAMLDRARKLVPAAKRKNFDDLDRVSRAAYCHYRSTYLQVRFVRLRDGGKRGAMFAAAMKKIVREEIDLARALHKIVRHDSRIGFEAANHYSYTLNDLKEKAIQCAWLLRRIGKTEKRDAK